MTLAQIVGIDADSKRKIMPESIRILATVAKHEYVGYSHECKAAVTQSVYPFTVIVKRTGFGNSVREAKQDVKNQIDNALGIITNPRSY